jgi:uncharacterized protein YkwD
VTTVIASLAIAAPAAQAADCAGANLLPAIASVPTAKAATLCLLNSERASHGLAPLASEATLESAATAYSQAMVRQRFFAHVSPGGQTLSQRLRTYVASAGNWATGENLAWGEGTLATPAAIVRNWMLSPAHRDNILDRRFEEIGVGIVGGSPVGSLPAISATYTTEFGVRGAPPSASSPTRAVASSAKRSTKRISAKKKAQISKRCHRIAKRAKASKKTRKARYSRCMRTQLAAARR